MNLPELQKQIVENKLLQFNLFTGEEVGIMDIYINKMAEVLNADKVRLDSTAEVWSKMQKRRMTGNVRLFIVRDDKELLKDEKLQQKIRDFWLPFGKENYSSPDYVLLIYTTLDKRGKFYKAFQNDIIEFSKLSADVLHKYILKELPGISAKESNLLAEVCDYDYSRILLECDKIRHYSRAAKRNDYGLVLKILVAKGIIHKPVGDITFKFTDAILTRNVKDTAEYLLQAKAKGESEILVLSTLYNGFKQILMVQGLSSDQSDPCKRTGLTPWQVKMAKEKQGHYELYELVNALKIIRDVEKGIKTGTIDAECAIEYAIVNIM